jgi:hypothetical protein
LPPLQNIAVSPVGRSLLRRPNLAFSPAPDVSANPEGCQTVAGGQAPATPPDRARKRTAPRRGARPGPRLSRSVSADGSARLADGRKLNPLQARRAAIFVATPSQNQFKLRRSGTALPPLQNIAVSPVGRSLLRRPNIAFSPAPGRFRQPGGLPDSSRGASASDTPGSSQETNRTPAGCQTRPRSSRSVSADGSARLADGRKLNPLQARRAAIFVATPSQNQFKLRRSGTTLPPLQNIAVSPVGRSLLRRPNIAFSPAPGRFRQPGGLPDSSRGSSASDTPGSSQETNRTPAGCQTRPPLIPISVSGRLRPPGGWPEAKSASSP